MKYTSITNRRENSTSFMLDNNAIINEDEYKEQVSNLYMPQIDNIEKKEKILNQAVILEEITTELGSSAILFYEKKNYLKVTKDDNTLLLIDTAYQPYRYIIIQIMI